MLTITSQRIHLKRLICEDVSPKYVDWLNDPDVNRFLETRFSLQTILSCKNYVSNLENDPLNFLFGIFITDTNQHIGNIKLGFINKHHQKGQISLFIGEKNSWGKGYGKESIKAITQWGFKELHLERIEAGCYAGNTASLQAFLTVGFSVEGFLRNNFINGEHRCGSFLMGIIRNDQIN